jgi:ABC-type transport system substrate-binding protein
VAAARLVRTGKSASLSRPFPVTPSAENPRPAQHFMYTIDRPNAMITDDADEKILSYVVTGAPQNTTGYSNPQVDALARQTGRVIDEAGRLQVVRQIEKILDDDLPRVPLCSRVSTATYWGMRTSCCHPIPKLRSTQGTPMTMCC